MTSDMKHRNTPALSELSDVELEALADAVEAGRPLDYPYFRWTQHMRRYVLFYWTTLLFVMMGISMYQTPTSYLPLMPEPYHWMLTFVLALVTFWLSPKITDQSHDVQESVREVVYRLARIQNPRKTLSDIVFWQWWLVALLMTYGVYWLLHELHLYPPVTILYIMTIFSVYNLLRFLAYSKNRCRADGGSYHAYESYLESWRNPKKRKIRKLHRVQLGIHGKRKVIPIFGFLRWFGSMVFPIFFFLSIAFFLTYHFMDSVIFEKFSVWYLWFKGACLLSCIPIMWGSGFLLVLSSFESYKTNSICLAIMQVRQES